MHHPEGDVQTHTRRVYDALVDDPAFQALDEADRQDLGWAAMLHDVGKPDTTRREGGRFTSQGHSRRGAVLARRIRWQRGYPFERRERVCRLIRTYMRPAFALEQRSIEREIILLSWQVPLNLPEFIGMAFTGFARTVPATIGIDAGRPAEGSTNRSANV